MIKKKQIIKVLVELVIFYFNTIWGIMRAVAPALVFAMFFIVQDIEIKGGVAFLIVMGIIAGIFRELRFFETMRELISHKCDKTIKSQNTKEK